MSLLFIYQCQNLESGRTIVLWSHFKGKGSSTAWKCCRYCLQQTLTTKGSFMCHGDQGMARLFLLQWDPITCTTSSSVPIKLAVNMACLTLPTITDICWSVWRWLWTMPTRFYRSDLTNFLNNSTSCTKMNLTLFLVVTRRSLRNIDRRLTLQESYHLWLYTIGTLQTTPKP